MKFTLGLKLSLVVFVTVIMIGLTGFLSGSQLIQQLSELTQDKNTDAALMKGRESVFELHKLRREQAETDIASCIRNRTFSGCLTREEKVNIKEGVATDAIEPHWKDENTFVTFFQGREWQATVDWTPLRPVYDDISETIQTRSHLSQIVPEINKGFRKVFGLAMILTGVFGILVAFFLGRSIRLRVGSLTNFANRIALGKVERAPTQTQGNDEVGILAKAMESMAYDLDALKNKLVYAEKLNSWQSIAKKVAHEIKNPLTPISLVADQISKVSENAPPHLETMLNESSRILREEISSLDRMVREFGSFSRLPSPQKKREDLAEVILDFTERNPSSGHQQLTFEQNTEITYPVEVDKHMIFQVLHNLVNNARLAKDPDPIDVRFWIESTERDWHMMIQDNGPGIPSHIKETLFDAYVTTRSTGERERGMGLGLAISRKIAEDHGGSLYLKSTSSEGSCFCFSLPKISEDLEN